MTKQEYDADWVQLYRAKVAAAELARKREVLTGMQQAAVAAAAAVLASDTAENCKPLSTLEELRQLLARMERSCAVSLDAYYAAQEGRDAANKAAAAALEAMNDANAAYETAAAVAMKLEAIIEAMPPRE